MPAQYGEAPAQIIHVEVQGTDTIKAGYALCLDHDATAARDRTYNAEKPSSANLHQFVGVVDSSTNQTVAPIDVRVAALDTRSGPVAVWTNANITAGDLLGPMPGSYACAPGSPIPCYRALESVDRSTTAGVVLCQVEHVGGLKDVGKIEDLTSGYFRFHTDFSELAALVDTSIGLFTVATVDGGGDDGEIIVGGTANGLSVVTNDADNDAVNLRCAGLEINTAKGWYMRATGVQGAAAATTGWFLGLSLPTDTTITAGVTDRVGFECADGSASLNILAVSEKDSTQTDTEDDTGVDFADSTTLDLEVLYDGAAVRFYINGAEVASYTSNIPSDEDLIPAFEVLARAAAAKTMNIRTLTVSGYRG